MDSNTSQQNMPNAVPFLNPERELPAPHDMQLPPPHYTHRHSWIHWIPAIVGLMLGMSVGYMFIDGAHKDQQALQESMIQTIEAKPSSIPNSVKKKKSSLKTYENKEIGFTANFPSNFVEEHHNVPGFREKIAGEDGILIETYFRVYKNANPAKELLSIEWLQKFYVNYPHHTRGTNILRTIKEKDRNEAHNYIVVEDKDKTMEKTNISVYIPNGTNVLYVTFSRKDTDEEKERYDDFIDTFIESLTFATPSISVKPTLAPVLNSSTYVCTQELKQCPDGSHVRRIGPSCEFAPCTTMQP